ncbi:bifunctional riboflavin kinase/FAD synthetase [Helicobacter mehlei]|uniref:Riboflavin biosynthesis protein n=1 Tax=Helicobacter mehlei TaxID=2316080 RepID=A0A553UWH9_9HELI|nr:bifunctional riboflavin kinase/FAD synthetase [Helicobacter mehlei]TSA84567.1 bifunctional riboflavin kinase/FAD synthetase [Helicobacter mehlei]
MQKLLSISHANITSLAIGKFDGVHVAHQRLLKRLSPPAGVLVVASQEPQKVLTSLSQRACLLQQYAQEVFFLPLERARALAPQDFTQLLEQKFPHLQKIIVGYDFKFGKDRIGDVHTLHSLLSPHITLEITPEIKIKGISLHSYHIKECIKRGEVALAHKFLGRPFVIEGPVVMGQQLGHKKLYATLNLALEPTELLPSFGVYATRVEFSHACFWGVSFLGHRLSTDGKLALETHVLDAQIPTTPHHLRVIFVKKIRNNTFFKDLESLKHQISLDILKAKSILKLQ